MLSLDNSYNSEDLVDFDRKAREATGLDKIEYCVEPKFDGGSISLIYEDDMLARGATRGNGAEGDEITTNIKQIRSIPLSAKFSEYGLQQVEIRGEVLINKSNFANYNQQLIEQGLPPLANPRNAASGTLRIKDSSEVRKRNLEAFVYHISFYTKTKKVNPALRAEGVAPERGSRSQARAPGTNLARRCLRCRRRSHVAHRVWIPACAGMTNGRALRRGSRRRR